MSIAEATELADVMNRVKTWPTTLRITLGAKSLNLLIKLKRRPARPGDTWVIGSGSPGLAQDRPPHPR